MRIEITCEDSVSDIDVLTKDADVCKVFVLEKIPDQGRCPGTLGVR